MNHLAHIYLSGTNKQLVIGNYIADYIRGNNYQHLPSEIITGIKMHRAIDEFTDNHTLFREATKLVRPSLSKFSGVAIDIFFDYFLANNWKDYHNTDLNSFSDEIYSLIKNNWDYIPEKGRRFYTYMVAHNLLLNYREMETLTMVFKGIDSRTQFETNLTQATYELNSNHDRLNDLFVRFFNDLKQFSSSYHE